MPVIIILSFVTAIIIVLCVVILVGKGDHLIAGYNTASEEKQRQYNIKRLRLVVASICFFTILACWVPLLTDNPIVKMYSIPMLTFSILCIGLILINSWCKKKP